MKIIGSWNDVDFSVLRVRVVLRERDEIRRMFFFKNCFEVRSFGFEGIYVFSVVFWRVYFTGSVGCCEG